MYILEGNIGAGKSTFLKLVAQHLPHLQVILEPLATWQHPVHGESILTNFCHNPKRWAYSFETLTMMCRVKDHLAQQKESNKLRILERSIYSGHYCFALNSYNQRYMNELEWKMYNEWFNFLVLNTCQPPLGFIYLRVDPAIAHTRIAKRKRIGEEEFSLGYLQQIHERHESFLIKKEHILPALQHVPVLTLNCDREFEHDPKVLQQHLDAIQAFITETAPSVLAARTTCSQKACI